MIYFIGLLLIAAQIYLAVHAYRRGKTNWIYFIAFVPLVGSGAYFFAEWLPEIERHAANSQSGQRMNEVAEEVTRLANPSKLLEKLKEQLEFSDTFENRLAVARECVSSGLYDEAIEMYKSALAGVFSDNPAALQELAQTYFLNKDYQQAIEQIDQLRAIQPDFRRAEVGTFCARVLEQLGRDEDAMDEYNEVIKSPSGYEARVRYALLLKKNGQLDEALEHFEYIMSRTKEATRQYRRSQKQWIDIARQNLD